MTALDLSQCVIEAPEALRPLSTDHALIELALSGNPICKRHGARMRFILLGLVPQLQILDHVTIDAPSIGPSDMSMSMSI